METQRKHVAKRKVTKGEETKFQFTEQRPNFSATGTNSKKKQQFIVIATANGPQVTTGVTRLAGCFQPANRVLLT